MMSANVAILSKSDSWHSGQLADALRQKGIEPSFSSAAQLKAVLGSKMNVMSGNIVLSDMDLILVRNVPGGSLEQIIYRMDVLHQLEDSGVCLVNRPGAIEKMVDKYYTLSLLQQAGLRVPETVLTEQSEEAMQAFHWLGGDVIIKPLFGSRGIGMVRLTDEDTAFRTFQALRLGHYVYYLQRFIPHDHRDVRTMVVGGKCIAAMERRADSWKTNISAEASPFPHTPSKAEIEYSFAAAKAVDADCCGVDLMTSEDGNLYAIEVNSTPAWKGLQTVTPVNIADTIVSYCLSRI